MAGCTTYASPPPPPIVGTGWSRAPDLSVYAAMRTAAQMAREQDVLCWGRNPAQVDDYWNKQFGPREAWIAAALAARYGDVALEVNGQPMRTAREDCPDIIDDYWHDQHAQLLHMLELRLYPKSYWSAG